MKIPGLEHKVEIKFVYSSKTYKHYISKLLCLSDFEKVGDVLTFRVGVLHLRLRTCLPVEIMQIYWIPLHAF